MNNLEFEFDAAPWEDFLESLGDAGTYSSAQLLSLMENEDEQTLEEALDQLLCATPAASGSVLDGTLSASWHRHVGGEPDEA